MTNVVALYGANASGKSNLLNGLKVLKKIIQESDTYNSENDYSVLMPFAFSDKVIPISFGISFIENNQHYKYEISFSALDFSIESEKIYKSDVGKNGLLAEKLIIERKDDTFTHFSKELRNLISEYKTQNFEYKSLLSIFINAINKDYFSREMATSSFKDIQTVYDFITQKIAVLNDEYDESIIANRILKDADFKKRLLIALKDLDFSISDFEVQDVTKDYVDGLKSLLSNADEETLQSVGSIENLIQNINKKRQYRINTIHRYGKSNEEQLPFSVESQGTQKFVRDLIEIVDAISEGKVLIVDELERSYHPLVQEYILNLFLEQHGTNGQLLFATHNSRFMTEANLAKEQIWFVEKDRKTLKSEVYSLADFPEITTNNHNWENMYLEGRMGAIPKVIQ